MNFLIMRRLMAVIIAFATIFFIFHLQCNSAQSAQQITIVFAPIETRGFGGDEFSTKTLNKIIEAIIRNYRQYRILEREALDRVFRELRFTLTYDNTSRATEAGRLLGADFLILIKAENSYQSTPSGVKNVVTGNELYNFNGSCKVTIKTLSLYDGSIRDLYNSPGWQQFIGQGDNVERIGWGMQTERLVDCFAGLFFKETQDWYNRIDNILRK